MADQSTRTPGGAFDGRGQVGKTTLLLQAVEDLLDDGARPENILYATFDHPLLKLIGLDGLLKVWRELQPPTVGPSSSSWMRSNIRRIGRLG